MFEILSFVNINFKNAVIIELEYNNGGNMIKDNIKNFKFYTGISDRIRHGFEWIINSNLEKMSDGRYEIEDGIYANLQTYETKDDALYEAHRDYIDIQYMIEGSEKCGVAEFKTCKTATKYDKERDIEFLNTNSGEYFTLNSGEFFVFFPQDAHKPSLNNNYKQKVKKVVVKVHI